MEISIGVLMGLMIAGLAVFFLARTRMVEIYEVKASFDEACGRFAEAVIQADNWSQPLPAWDMQLALDAKGLAPEGTRNLKVFFVCKAPYAERILGKRPEMASMMPCSWVFYERQDGRVFVAKMNIGMMSKVFTGNIIGSVMGRVAREERQILSRLPVQLGS